MPNNFFPSNVRKFILSHNANLLLPLTAMPIPPDADSDVKANANDGDEYDDFPNTRYNANTHLDEVCRYEKRDCNFQDS